VNRVASRSCTCVIAGATNPSGHHQDGAMRRGGTADPQVKVDWIVPGSTLSSTDSGAVMETCW